MPTLRPLTRSQLAEAFGTHPQTIVKWEQQGMPIAQRGGRGRPSHYALPACVAWFISRELAARGVAGDRLDPVVERASLDRQRREEIEFRLALKRGEYLKSAEVESGVTRLIHEARAQLLATPTRARQRLPHLSDSDMRVLDQLVRDILDDLAAGAQRAGLDPSRNAHQHQEVTA